MDVEVNIVIVVVEELVVFVLVMMLVVEVDNVIVVVPLVVVLVFIIVLECLPISALDGKDVPAQCQVLWPRILLVRCKTQLPARKLAQVVASCDKGTCKN